MAKPKIKTTCPAGCLDGPNDRTVEFSDGKGNGGLISFQVAEDGKLIVMLYRMKPNVIVICPKSHLAAETK
jgi:hypothetical protein